MVPSLTHESATGLEPSAHTLENTVEAGAWIDCSRKQAPAGALTILLVEDEKFVREATRNVLRAVGYRVLTARSAEEAERVYDLQRDHVKLLLTDVVLPGESGISLAGRLRRENTGLGVIFVTGYGEKMRLSESEPGECLAKPFSAGVLLQRIRDILAAQTSAEARSA